MASFFLTPANPKPSSRLVCAPALPNGSSPLPIEPCSFLYPLRMLSRLLRSKITDRRRYLATAETRRPKLPPRLRAVLPLDYRLRMSSSRNTTTIYHQHFALGRTVLLAEPLFSSWLSLTAKPIPHTSNGHATYSLTTPLLPLLLRLLLQTTSGTAAPTDRATP